ncbi:uncharacterized protein TNCV_207251 [Trichonephila clavipes]|nr:uncharacterized protein TNCV_207251 [Trichonephila clavipes]
MAPSLSHLQRYHEVEYGFCHKLSLVTKHGVILNPKASLRASSGNVRLHHLQRNQRPGTPVRVSGTGNHHQCLALSSLMTEP